MPIDCCPYPVGCVTNVFNNWLFDGWGWGCWIVGGSLNFGALLAGVGRLDESSPTPNDMISTILETSFLTRSGREFGRSLPVNLRLQRYMASANSGNRSWPDLVVSDKVLCLLALDYGCKLLNVPDVGKRIAR